MLNVLLSCHHDTFTNVDNFLTQQGYADLVRQPLHRTPSELRNKEQERFLEILETHTDADDQFCQQN